MKKFLVTLFLGWAGVHKFTEKKVGIGILYLCTFGLFFFGWIYDTIKALIQLLKERTEKTLILEVAGTSYLQKELTSVAYKNWKYNSNNEQSESSTDKIYRYNYTHKSALLIPEPTNPHDSNAIKVLVDGIHIGYIPATACIEVNNMIKHSLITSINVEIYGGEYKNLVLLSNGKYDYAITDAQLNARIKIN